MKRFGPTAVALVLCLVLPGCGKSKMSKANYDKVQEGMSLREVETLLGKGMDITTPPNRPSSGSTVGAAAGIDMPSGTESGPALLPGVTRIGKVMQWGEEDRVIQVVFVNDKVAVKQQKGL